MSRIGLSTLILCLAACPQDKDSESAGPDIDTSTGTGTTDATGSTGSTGALDEDCAFLPGKAFIEDGGYECPLEPGKTCYDEIRFMAATYDYYHSDYLSSGEYACKGGVIDETQASMPAIGTIDAAAGKLTWKSKTFTVSP